jgi:hypothetical protein
MANRDTGGLGAEPETLTVLHWQSDKQDRVNRKRCFMDGDMSKTLICVLPIKQRFLMNWNAFAAD